MPPTLRVEVATIVVLAVVAKDVPRGPGRPVELPRRPLGPVASTRQ